MFAHNGSLNRGCEAIVRSSTKMIKSTIPEAKVILASGRPDTDKVISNIDEIFDGSEKKLSPNFIDKIKFYLELKLFKSEQKALTQIYDRIIKRVDYADICLSIGGDNYCYGEQDWLYAIDKNIKKKNKKLALWACSIGEEDLSDKKLEDLKNFDLILARESLTYGILKSNGLDNVKLCADPAFTMETERVKLPDGWRKGDTIGVNFSPLVMRRNPESREAVEELIKYILENTKSVIALIPHVIDEGNNDYELLAEFYNNFKDTGRVILLPDNLTAPEYKGYISQMRFFIGARTHATIAAYSNCVPTMVLGYSVKSRGIAKDIFGEEKLVLGIKDLSDKEKLSDGFNELLRDEEKIKSELKKRIPKIKNKANKAVEYLKELAE